LKTTVVAVVGGKKSGKTTVVETLTREMTRRGYRVATVKHIPEPSFTVDTEGKDTWRFARAGARVIVAVSADEVATIEKGTGNLPLKEILRKCEGNDLIFVEGFRRAVSRDKGIYKIVVVKSVEEESDALRSFSPILAFAGSFPMVNLKSSAPYFDSLRDYGKIADIVEETIKKGSS
jgi:molybdopterin-guanine dinucleotide biosynthesis protein MobB